MDDEQREYIDAVNKLVENTDKGIPDEVVWLEITKCLINNAGVTVANSNNAIVGIADWYLQQFKNRFRE
jgi:hypothetical protein